MWPFILIFSALGFYYFTRKPGEPISHFEILPNMWENPHFKAKITPEWETKQRPDVKDINNVEPPRHIFAFLQKSNSTDPPFLGIFEVTKAPAEKNGFDRIIESSYIVGANYDLNNPTANADDIWINKYMGDQPKSGDTFKIQGRDIFVMLWGDRPGGYKR